MAQMLTQLSPPGSNYSSPSDRFWSQVAKINATPPRVESHPLHSHALLEHIVKHVLPNKPYWRPAEVQDFYRSALDYPDATIEICKGLLEPWVMEAYEGNALYDYDALKRYKVTRFHSSHGIYVHRLRDAEFPTLDFRSYAGQAENLEKRVAGMMSDATRSPPVGKGLSMSRVAWRKAYDGYTLVPVRNRPVLRLQYVKNVMEHWMSVLFLSLQPRDLRANMTAEAYARIPESMRETDLNDREPLAHGFPFDVCPYRHVVDFWTDDPVKLKYYRHTRRLSW